MTDQISHQMPGQALPPGPLTGQPPSPAASPRRCKQPGCGTELPAAAGRGAPRLFCSPACSRKWHNDNRSAAGAAAGRQAAAPAGPSDGGPLAGLHQLLTQAAGLVSAAAAQLAAADPGKVTAALAAADAARGQAQAETAVALARAAEAAQAAAAATAAMHAARHDTQAALEAADQARADAEAADARAQAIGEHADAQVTAARAAASAAETSRDAALADAARARHHADTEISRARQAEADARAENDHVRADAARERDAQAAALTAQLAAVQDLAGTWRARAEHAEHQLDLERDYQRRLTAQAAAPSTSSGAPAKTTTRPATAKTAAGSRP
jgi:hypothetical protein